MSVIDITPIGRSYTEILDTALSNTLRRIKSEESNKKLRSNTVKRAKSNKLLHQKSKRNKR